MSFNSKDLLKQALENLKQRDEKFHNQEAELKLIQAELSAKSSKIEQLQEILKNKHAEVKQLKAQLKAKDAEIHQLKSQLSESIPQENNTFILQNFWGIDYTSLQQLLSEQKWQAANQETAKIMLEVMGKNKIGYLTEKEIHEFPSQHFKLIDSLWEEYSQGRFGFSVQKNIFHRLKYQRKILDYNGFTVLVGRLGWAESDPGKEWLGGHIFDLTAPPGHLPELASHIPWQDAQFPVTKVIIRLRVQRAFFSLL